MPKSIIFLLGKRTGNYLAGNVTETLESCYCVVYYCTAVPVLNNSSIQTISNCINLALCYSFAFTAKSTGNSEEVLVVTVSENGCMKCTMDSLSKCPYFMMRNSCVFVFDQNWME